MRKVAALSLVLLCSCQNARDAIDLQVRKHGDHLVGEIESDQRLCIVTYKIYFRRFGLFPVYGKRLGIDIRGECEIEVPAGRSTASFGIEDSSFRTKALETKLCVDVTYYVGKGGQGVSLKHRAACV